MNSCGRCDLPRRPVLRVLICALMFAGTSASWSKAQSPVYLSVQTTTANDTLVAGVPGALHFHVDSVGSTAVSAVTWPLELRFTGGNVIGAITTSGIPPNVGIVPWPVDPDSALFLNPTGGADPDTILMHLARAAAPFWTEGGELWRISLIPSDSGSIIVDTATVLGLLLTVLDAGGQPLPIVWQPRTITVAPYCPSGDLNSDGIVNDMDLYILVRYIQQGGPPPTACLAHADVDGNGEVTSADIIILIHYIYHGDRTLCYTCGLIEQGVWTCP